MLQYLKYFLYCYDIFIIIFLGTFLLLGYFLKKIIQSEGSKSEPFYTSWKTLPNYFPIKILPICNVTSKV